MGEEMVQEKNWARAAGEKAAHTHGDPWGAGEAPRVETRVLVNESAEALDKGGSWVPYLVASFFLSFIFPPVGCIAFCLSLGAPSGSACALWGERALGLGALLSFLYTLLLAMLLSEFYYIPNSGAILGFGYDQ